MRQLFLYLTSITVCIFLKTSPVNCQLSSNLCFQDSTNFLKFDILLDDLFKNDYKIEDLLEYFLRQKDKKCLLLLYANIFNKLQKEGLDLNYDIVKNPPQSSSVVSAIEGFREQIDQEIKENNDPFRRYTEFLNYNKKYKRFISFKYKNSDNELKEEVYNIISNNLFVKPSELENILLLCYKHHTKDRLYQQIPIRELSGKN